MIWVGCAKCGIKTCISYRKAKTSEFICSNCKEKNYIILKPRNRSLLVFARSTGKVFRYGVRIRESGYNESLELVPNPRRPRRTFRDDVNSELEINKNEEKIKQEVIE